LTKKAAPTTREKILETTIHLINREGLRGITTRKISSEAGVNIASINYHFRSKNALIREALAETLEALLKMPAKSLDRTDLAPHERLLNFFLALMEGGITWPGIAKAYLYEPLMKNNYETPFVSQFNDFVAELMSKLKDVRIKDGAADPRLVFIQVLSAAMLPGLMPRLFHGFSGADFSDPELRRAYAVDLLARYFET
jgi:TetR/AcrR family transcriptional regulator, regulator of cefoperazone and chloramphenicol sensitivity